MPDSLPVMEAFYTLQGEGYHAGTAAYFIRLGGCDVGCVWCDVKESWDASIHPKVPITDLVGQAGKFPSGKIVITGGEPLMYDLSKLTAQLKSQGLEVHVETAGVYPVTGSWDWICFSPKKFKAPLDEYYSKSQELKVIIYHKSDLEWAEGHAKKMNPNAKLFLQPEWDRRDQIMPLIVDYVKENPKWRISLQTHKYLDIP